MTCKYDSTLCGGDLLCEQCFKDVKQAWLAKEVERLTKVIRHRERLIDRLRAENDRRLMLAGMALQGYLANENFTSVFDEIAHQAEWAFEAADALLKYHKEHPRGKK